MILRHLKKYAHLAVFAAVFMVLEVYVDLLQPRLLYQVAIAREQAFS